MYSAGCYGHLHTNMDLFVCTHTDIQNTENQKVKCRYSEAHVKQTLWWDQEWYVATSVKCLKWVRIKVRFKIRVRVRFRVRIRFWVRIRLWLELYLGLGCDSLYKYNWWIWAEIFLLHGRESAHCAMGHWIELFVISANVTKAMVYIILSVGWCNHEVAAVGFLLHHLCGP